MMFSQKKNWNRITLAVVMFSLALLSYSKPVEAQEKKKLTNEEYYEMMKVFVDTFEQIERNYVKEVDRRELMESAIRGMIGKLDQYSSYISPQDISRFNQSVEQQFGGVGIQVQIDPHNKRLTVTSPMPDTPAYKGGIKAGDIIMEIEGKSTVGFTMDDAIKLIKGKPGEPITLGIKHLDSEKIEQIKLVRAIIQVSTVRGDHYDDAKWNYFVNQDQKIGYVRLTHFSRHSFTELKAAMKQLKKQEMKALILDLRFNPGGLLSQATAISDLFVDQGKIVSTKGRNTKERVWNAKKPGTYKDFPMAVLVNKYSASASEIVSACLQDHKRAIVIGERTWGKGSVQNVIELEGGGSALKLTTASYHRPSGKNIHRFPGAKKTDEWGVMPDDGFLVPFTTEEMQQYLEYRREKDIINSNQSSNSSFKDKQLDKAVEYLTQKLNDGQAAINNSTKKQQAVSLPGNKPANSDTRRKSVRNRLLRHSLPPVRAT